MGPYLSIGMDYLIAFHAFTFFLGDGGAKPAFWDIQSISSRNQFPPHPMDKMSFVHPTYTPMGPYLSIGMDYLIAFHAFTLF